MYKEKLKEMFSEMVIKKDASLIPIYYHENFLLYTNGEVTDYQAFLTSHQEYYSTAEINGENKNQQPSSYSSIHKQNYPLDNYDKMSFRN